MAKTWYEKYSTSEEVVNGAVTGITAYAGGGQANATQLTAKFNTITVVATDGDSVKLPAALVGMSVYIFNKDAAQYADVYPQSGEYNDGTLNGATQLSAGSGRCWTCIFDGYWHRM